jgi:hypothetical protein
MLKFGQIEIDNRNRQMKPTMKSTMKPTITPAMESAIEAAMKPDMKPDMESATIPNESFTKIDATMMVSSTSFQKILSAYFK